MPLVRPSHATRTVVAAVLVLAAPAKSSSAILSARQDAANAPDLSTTTSINWWPYGPYPSWGAGTTTAVTDPSTFTPVSSFIAAVSLTGTDAASDGGTPTQSTSAPSSTASSPTSTGSMIYITALPPARTPRRNLKRTSKGSFNIAYLAPLFAVIGIAVGMLLTWLVFCLSRGMRSRATPLRAGPKYSAPPAIAGNVDDEAEDVERPSGSRFLDLMRQGKRSLRESVLSRGNSSKTSRLKCGNTAHRREPAAMTPQRSVSHGAAERGDASMSYMEDDPFLVPPAGSGGVSSPPGNVRSAQQARSQSALSRSPLSADVFSDDDDDDVPYDTLRHKSIRRGILERLKYGSRYRGSHRRADSDVRVDEVRTGGAYAPVSLAMDRSPSRTSGATGSEPHVLPLVGRGDSGPGFRIVQEDTDTEPGSSQDGGLLGLNWTLPWVASPDKLNTEDKFTVLPSRRSLADKRCSPSPGVSQATSSTSTKELADDDTTRPALPRVDSSVLPSSPPRVTSPPLEAQLFFGTIPPKFGSTPQLNFAFAGAARSAVSSPASTGSPRPRGKKLHTKRGPPLLPFPSYGKSSPHSKRLAKTPTHDNTTHDGQTPASHPTPTKALTPAERYVQRHGAHDKVEDIVTKSYSTRKMKGEDRVGSPTMFGAITQSDEPPKGIEQQLLS